MPGLPVHSLGDIHLADLFDGRPGCPLCAVRTDAARTFIESTLAEGVNDVPLRRHLRAARGVCRRHARDVLAADRQRSGGGVAASILFASMLGLREEELAAALDSDGRSRTRRLAEAAMPAACPICRHAAQAEAGAATSLVHLAGEPAWADALGEAAFCLDHLLLLARQPDRPARWHAVDDRQMARLRDIRARLESFVHRSSHDRRHLLTDDDRRAVDEGAALLGGTEERR